MLELPDDPLLLPTEARSFDVRVLTPLDSTLDEAAVLGIIRHAFEECGYVLGSDLAVEPIR